MNRKANNLHPDSLAGVRANFKRLKAGLKRNGRYVTIQENINCIPAGTYKCLRIDAHEISMSYGSKLFFTISSKGFDKMDAPPIGTFTPTSLDEFLDRYYSLLQAAQNQRGNYDPAAPFTMCGISPAIARDVH